MICDYGLWSSFFLASTLDWNCFLFSLSLSPSLSTSPQRSGNHHRHTVEDKGSIDCLGLVNVYLFFLWATCFFFVCIAWSHEPSWWCVGVFGSLLLVLLQYSSSYQSRTKTSPAKVVEAEISWEAGGDEYDPPMSSWLIPPNEDRICLCCWFWSSREPLRVPIMCAKQRSFCSSSHSLGSCCSCGW